MDEIDFPELTNMGHFAVTAHEMFTALVDAGFSEDRALKFCVRFALDAATDGSKQAE